MAKSLVIVESPAKARTINKYLGSQYVVESSVGHIRDLPEGGSARAGSGKSRAKEAAATLGMKPAQKAAHRKRKKWQQLVGKMGIDPERNWEAHYEIKPGKEKVVAELQKLARNADCIYLATDLDREGEAIAWHLTESIGGDPERYKRVVFNEITRRAINKAFTEPGELDMRYVEAQQARRFLDRVVGYMVSPLLWTKVARGLSAGRVQSVAVRLVVERERAINVFVPEEYWEVFANLEAAPSATLRCQVMKEDDKRFRPSSKAGCDAALAVLQKAEYRVVKRDDKPTTSRPRPPLITSTLQQAASTALGFGVKRTMQMAQRLYESGHITYMRTDSTHLGNDSVAACREYIGQHFGAEYLPAKPVRYSPRKGAQEAHEAIRPTDVRVTANRLEGMEASAVRLYELIWRYFVACQMPPARYLSSTVTVAAERFELRADGRIMQFDGYQKIMQSGKEDTVLPAVEAGQLLRLQTLDPEQNFTRPPPRYTEASLVRELEKRGIGRPSTYASIISTIQERGYVQVDNRRFRALKMGEIVTDRLQESFSDLMDYDFTARMEDSLDEVAAGHKNWTKLLDDFYRGFTSQLARADAEEGGMRGNTPTMTDIPCPLCERPMQLRTASTGVFLSCSGYSLPQEQRCKGTRNLSPGEEAVRADTAEEAEARENLLLRSRHRCPVCNTAMDSYLVDEQRKLHVCGNNPDCAGFEVEEGEFKVRGYDGPVVRCDKCDADMQLKSGRFGKYFGCSNEDCSNTRKLLRNGQPAPPKMDPVPMPELACVKVDDHFVLRDGASGLFLTASKFPRHRETRQPLLAELLPHRNAIDPKYAWLLDGPVADDDGNPTVVRFSRKNQTHYLQAEQDGRPSGWKATHENGNWRVFTHPESRKSAPGRSAHRKTRKAGKAKAGSRYRVKKKS